MTSPNDDLTNSIRFLRNAAPDEFEQFRQAFERYSGGMRHTFIYAPDKLELAQGHAQMCEKILQFLNGATHGR